MTHAHLGAAEQRNLTRGAAVVAAVVAVLVMVALTQHVHGFALDLGLSRRGATITTVAVDVLAAVVILLSPRIARRVIDKKAPLRR